MAAGVLKDGLVVNIVTTATSTTQIRSQLERTIPNLKDLEAEKKFFLSDWYTWMTGAKSEEPISLDSLSLAKMSVDQSRFQRGQSPTYDLAVADNFSTFLKYNDERVFMQWFDKLVAGLKQFKGVRVYGFAKRFHSETLYSNIEALADGVIELDYREKNGRFENAIRVKTMKGFSHPTKWRSLKVLENGYLQLSEKN
jgi:KaiC/GvpD/RAD55 family RecA-like ATPase